MNIKETIKKDIEHIFSKMEKLRIEYPWDGLLSEAKPDFRPYRSMSGCLIDTFDNYKVMNDHFINKNDKYIKYFIDKLTYEVEKLHEVIETNKEDYLQFKCLNDAFIKLTKLLYNLNKNNWSKIGE